MMSPLVFDTYYHVYNHANGDEDLFRSDENYRYFLQQWAKYIEPIAYTYAYCLMPNHIHFLIRTKSEEDVLEFVRLKKPTLQGFQTLGGLSYSRAISLQFSHLFNGYTQAFNKMYGRKGSLFMQNFKRKEIMSEHYLIAIVNYIHRNPVHHGFCGKHEDWVHSSYHAYLSESPTKIRKDDVLNWFNGKTEFVKFHEENKMLMDKSLYIDE